MGPYIVHGHFMYGNTFCMPRPPYYNTICHHRAPGWRHLPPQRLIADDADTGVGYAEPEGYDTGDGDCTNIVRYSNMPNITAITAKRISSVRIKLWGLNEDEDKVIDLEIGNRYAVVYLVPGGFATADGYLEYIDSSISDSCTKYTGTYDEDVLQSYIGLDCSTTGKSDKRKIYLASIRSIEELESEQIWEDEPEPDVTDISDLNKRLGIIISMLEDGLVFVDDIVGIEDVDHPDKLPANAKLDILLGRYMDERRNPPPPPAPEIGMRPIAPMEHEFGDMPTNPRDPFEVMPPPGTMPPKDHPMPTPPPPKPEPRPHHPDNHIGGIGFTPIAPMEPEEGDMPIPPKPQPGPHDDGHGLGFQPIAPMEHDGDPENVDPWFKQPNPDLAPGPVIDPSYSQPGPPVHPNDYPWYGQPNGPRPPKPYGHEPHMQPPPPPKPEPAPMPKPEPLAMSVAKNIMDQLDIIIYDLSVVAKALGVKVDVEHTEKEMSALMSLDFETRLSTIIYRLMKYNDDVTRILRYNNDDIDHLTQKDTKDITGKLAIVLAYLNAIQQ